MSIFGKIFGGKSNINITKDTKLSTSDIDKLLRSDKGNLALLSEAAFNGNLDCQIFLSKMATHMLQLHANGTSLLHPQNLAAVHNNVERLTTLAAEQGDANSQFNLAQYYLKKVDVSTKDTIDDEEAVTLKKAKYWYEQAHSNGHSDLSEVISSLEFLR